MSECEYARGVLQHVWTGHGTGSVGGGIERVGEVCCLVKRLLGQYAPLELSTAGTVRARMLRSPPSDQRSM